VPQIEVTFDIDANGILDVKAKDRATSREQQVRITASSMLSKDDVDKMVREAQSHAKEDAERRADVETRNQADALAFQAERTLKDLGEKVDPADRADVENKVNDLRDALKGSDMDRVRGAAAALTDTLQQVASKAYANTGPIDYDGGAGEGGSGRPDTDDETVEGEYKEV
jgi:molecular chaperone DnaK